MRAMGHIPVKRGTADARQSLDGRGRRRCDQGKIIVLHPEGTVTRDPDGWPMAGKTGAARLAMLVPDVPVIPIAQWGVQEQIDLYRKKIKLFPRPRHVMSVGEPIDLSAVPRPARPTRATLQRDHRRDHAPAAARRRRTARAAGARRATCSSGAARGEKPTDAA